MCVHWVCVWAFANMLSCHAAYNMQTASESLFCPHCFHQIYTDTQQLYANSWIDFSLGKWQVRDTKCTTFDTGSLTFDSWVWPVCVWVCKNMKHLLICMCLYEMEKQWRKKRLREKQRSMRRSFTVATIETGIQESFKCKCLMLNRLA